MAPVSYTHLDVYKRQHRLRQRVLLVRAVHPDNAHTVIIGHENWIGHICLAVALQDIIIRGL